MFVVDLQRASTSIRRPTRVEDPGVPTPAEWALEHFGQVDLGDRRLNRRAVEMATRMATHPQASLPNQMANWGELKAAYHLLNHQEVTMEALLAPSCQQTLEDARRPFLVLMVEDTTELDYTAHPSKEGLGKIGNGKGRGLLLHSTLAVLPESRQILGLAHAEVVVRQPKPKGKVRWTRSPEARVWESSARAVGAPPQGVTWVHVSDRGSDIFEYMATCLDLGKHFLVRAFHNRVLSGKAGPEPAEGEEAEIAPLLDYARSLPPCPDVQASYTVQVSAHKKQPARQAQVVMAWSEVSFGAPSKAPAEVREHADLHVHLLRVWEPNPPTGVDPVEWILLCSLPIASVEEALRTVDWYTCRWLCEDYHMCLKTGCRIEASQLDSGEDLRCLLGFLAPLAVRLLQLRQYVRQAPEAPVMPVVDPLMVEVLARSQKKDAATMTLRQFWYSVAQMGGHLGRRSDGPPGWRTLWKGWRELNAATEGARLVLSEQQPTKRYG
jgi:Transposase DNA-binding/Transposase Tn5 dimerisation domain